MINGDMVKRVHQSTDLGLVTSANFSWDTHSLGISDRVNIRLGLIKRTTGFEVNRNIKRISYECVVRPVLHTKVEPF